MDSTGNLYWDRFKRRNPLIFFLIKLSPFLLAICVVAGLYLRFAPLKALTDRYKTELYDFGRMGDPSQYNENGFELSPQEKEEGWWVVTQSDDYAIIKCSDEWTRLFFHRIPIKDFPKDSYGNVHKPADGFYIVSYTLPDGSDSKALYGAEGNLIESFGAKYIFMIGNDEFMVERDGEQYYIDRSGKRISEMRPVIFEDRYGEIFDIISLIILCAGACVLVYFGKRYILGKFRHP